MIEPVNTQDFTSQPERRKPEEFKYVKFRIEAGVARMTLSRPEHNLLMKPCSAKSPGESLMPVSATT